MFTYSAGDGLGARRDSPAGASARIASFSRAGRCISRDGLCRIIALGKDSWEGDSGSFSDGCGANEIVS